MLKSYLIKAKAMIRRVVRYFNPERVRMLQAPLKALMKDTYELPFE